MNSTSIGLDIGSSAVRAAEISIQRNECRLLGFAQVGLPPGAVVDGEVVNPIAVAAALRRLWSEGGFSSNKVVVGVSGHRLIIRQAELPALNEEDLRSSLRFNGQDLIPIPIEDAVFDFQILDASTPGDAKEPSMMRVLIVAAHREMLRGHLAALKEAGLEATAIDASPLALLRVVPPTGPDAGIEALVSIGAEVTTVAVRDKGVPRFIRTLAVGGSSLTTGIANSMHVEPAVAETLKRGVLSAGSPQMVQARRAMATDIRDIGEDVRATIDFFVSQAEGAHVDRLLVTGGASLTEGLVEQLAGETDVDIRRVDPFALLNLGDIGLGAEDVKRARAVAATAVGLALWEAVPASSRMSVIPREFAEARRNRRTAMLTAGAVAGLAGLLLVGGAAEALKVHSARSDLRDANSKVAVLQGQVSTLQAQTAVHSKVADRAGKIKTALTGDVDWVRVVTEVQSGMPGGLQISTVSASRASSAGSAQSGSAGVGTISFSLTGSGGLPTVAAWLDALQKDPSVQGSWVAGITNAATGADVTFTSSTNLTPHAESTRAQAVKP